ncbi:hypothetical protein [Burkholderia ubonensis]|uniref:Uncharacterized protein n=1 Tax=Burkholderia ubonensis subsp. mesacidophila TaxID=265293 RepID=A0A2A4FFC1_9BURK|nr:hypothetical protein [Burkholderia ubonensis]PCE32433.1 hypothetical protein BZL54_10555 [Burkholderia ubonensis subsp. mesacidophila]
MARAENTHNGFEYSVQTLLKQGVGSADLQIFGFHGFVLVPNDTDAQPATQIPIQCLEEEGYRRENWALDAAIDEAKAIIDGKRPLKDPTARR